MIGTRTQRQAVLGAIYPVWEPQTLFWLLQRKAEKLPEHPLLLTRDAVFSYRQVWQGAVKTAGALQALGIGVGSRAAVCLPNGLEYILLTFALSGLGAVKVPVNTELGPVERRCILEHVRPQLLLETDERGAIVCHGPALHRVLDWPGLLARAGEASPSFVEDASLPCDIIYTSGSNGRPKGVVLTSDMLLRSAYASCLNRGFELGRRIYVPLPLFHVYGYVEGLLAALLAEGAVLLQSDRFDAEQAISLMEQFQINDLLSVPSMMMNLLRSPALEGADLHALHAVYCSASACPAWLWPQIRQRLGVDDVVTGYGMTEVSGATIQTAPSDTDALLSRRVGRCLNGGCAGVPEWGGRVVDYRVADPETGAVLSPGQAGELQCRGPVVTTGYSRAPEADARAFTSDGWLKTGDVGRFDRDGCLELMGRLSDVYKMNGENVSPDFVERVIGQCGVVAHAEVVGVPDLKTGEAGAAFLELQPGAEPEAALEEIRQHCRRHLARYQLPKYYQILSPDEWPVTGSGKISKRMLKAMVRNGRLQAQKS